MLGLDRSYQHPVKDPDPGPDHIDASATGSLPGELSGLPGDCGGEILVKSPILYCMVQACHVLPNIPFPKKDLLNLNSFNFT